MSWLETLGKTNLTISQKRRFLFYFQRILSCLSFILLVLPLPSSTPQLWGWFITQHNSLTLPLLYSVLIFIFKIVTSSCYFAQIETPSLLCRMKGGGLSVVMKPVCTQIQVSAVCVVGKAFDTRVKVSDYFITTQSRDALTRGDVSISQHPETASPR